MSMEGVDVCWIEQGERLSERSFEILLPTIRQPGSEIWATFNPDESSDPVYRRFVATRLPGAIVKQVNYMDNPWFPPELDRERAYLFSVDPEAAETVWNGQPRTSQSAQILAGKYIIQPFTVPVDDGKALWSAPYYGCDFGFANDPTTLVRCWVAGAVQGQTQGRLMIDHEAWGVGIEISDTPRLFETVPGARQHLIHADCSRSETISHIRNSGFRIEPCEKWSGSVEDGVAFLRSFEKIIIHERCRHAIEEAKLYSFKRDRLTGIVMPNVKDGNDHIWDAVRYALGPLIQPQSDLRIWGKWGAAGF
jgi:phage terminase large subunit